jgi:uncharacterized protein
MIGIGTLVNALAIIIGGAIGLILKHNLKDRYKDIMIGAIGLSILVVGLSGALQGMFTVVNNTLSRAYILEMILILIIGSVVGTYLKINERLNNFGEYMQSKFSSGKGTFAKGFVTATLIFCVGAMAIMGALEDGLTGDATTLYTKAILDGTTAMILASTLGIGVIFSVIPLILYQGTITFTASILQTILVDDVKSLMLIVGNILIIGISLDLLEIKKIKVANMLPAIFIPIIYYFIIPIFNFIIELF